MIVLHACAPAEGPRYGTSELASFPDTWRLADGVRAISTSQEAVASNAPLASAAGHRAPRHSGRVNANA